MAVTAEAHSVEYIGDEERVSRLIDFPSMYNESRTALTLKLVCAFPEGQDESVVWRRYAPEDHDVHRIGCTREAEKRQAKPETRYKGCGTTTAGAIRCHKNARGHGFSVRHAPEEGLHHASVAYAPANGVDLLKGDRTELKVWLGERFSNHASHDCPNPPTGSEPAG